MPYRVIRIGALRVVDPAQWEREIRRAMSRAEGRIPDAAFHLGIHRRTLFRWLQEPRLADVPRVAHGEPRPGNKRGRKPKSKTSKVA